MVVFSRSIKKGVASRYNEHLPILKKSATNKKICLDHRMHIHIELRLDRN